MNLQLFQPDPEPLFRVDCADALDWLRGLNSASVDCVITDPAYSSLEKHRAVGTTTRLTAQWFDTVDDAYFFPLFLELWRVLKESAHLYVFCDQTTLPVIRTAAEAADLAWHKFLVWDKCRIGMGYHYRARHELIGYMSKGSPRPLNDRGVADVLRCARVHGGYPTEKPVEILSTLVTQATTPGELVVDPFVGSGSTGAAAVARGRRFAGCDVNEEARELARLRIRETEGR